MLLVVLISYAVLFLAFRKHAPPKGDEGARRGVGHLTYGDVAVPPIAVGVSIN